MKHVNFFRYNIPADNHQGGLTDKYINCIAEWTSDYFFSDGRPMCYVNPVNMTFYEAVAVINWHIAYEDIKRIAENHFAELARMERINQARAILALEENPIFNRFESADFTG